MAFRSFITATSNVRCDNNLTLKLLSENCNNLKQPKYRFSLEQCTVNLLTVLEADYSHLVYHEGILRGYALGLQKEFVRKLHIIRQATFKSNVQQWQVATER